MSDQTTYSTGTFSLLPQPCTAKVSEALAKIQAEVRAARKSGKNTYDKYDYNKQEDFWEVGKPLLAKYECSLAFQTVEAYDLPPRTTKNGGTEHAVRVKVVGILTHASGEHLDFPGFGDGQDRADKAIYKAITGARKYVIAGALAIPTGDDPEADDKVGLTGKGNKLDSEGNAKTKIPKWTDAQKTEAGTLNTGILQRLTYLYNGDKPAMEELSHWKNVHKYDEPDDVIRQLKTWKTELEGTEQ